MTPVLPTARPEEVGLSSERLERLGKALERDIARKLIPGAVALVARRGKVAYCQSFGVRDPASGAPMAKDALFRIFSMTKPIVSVAVMMQVEEGRLLLTEPLAKHLPEFSDLRVGIERAPLARPVTIQDLLRHTSGLTYETQGTSPVQQLYAEAKLGRRDRGNAEFVKALAELPLLVQPGTHFHYSRSTDVLGRILEVLSGESLGAHLSRVVLAPLGMSETGFSAPEGAKSRIAEPFAKDPESGAPVQLYDPLSVPRLESGGGGLVSTVADYARFCQMLANRGTLDGVRLLSRKTIEHMSADHLGSIPTDLTMLPAGYGFGLGFAVRREVGIAPVAGSQGHYYWSGVAGTSFWIDPKEELYAILMTQGPGQREYFRLLFRNLVYAAIAD